VPDLARLPDPVRSCVLATMRSRLDTHSADPWYGWNLGRATSRDMLRNSYLNSRAFC
jgi:hypothetical protein